MSVDHETPIEIQVEVIRRQVAANAERVKTLGKWPAWKDVVRALVDRVPKNHDVKTPGFDAGVACALDLIPKNRQELSAEFHGAYTPEAIAKVRQEIENLDPDSETAWWLAACYVCGQEGTVDQEAFLRQIEQFKKLGSDPEERKQKALLEYKIMTHDFSTKSEFGNDVPYGEKAGCTQGAYLVGYPFGVEWASNYGIYFIGTFYKSLGLEDFEWSIGVDDQGRPKSGPVGGSQQYIKCANKEEVKRVLEIVKRRFSKELAEVNKGVN